MRHFHEELKEKGFCSHYIRLDDERSKGSFGQTLVSFLRDHSFDKVVVTEPGEWRVLEELKELKSSLKIPLEILPDTRFYCSIEEFKKWANGRKILVMEQFYRLQRKQHGILLKDDGKPAGGEWNFDKENRKAIKGILKLPKPMRFQPDEITNEVIRLVSERFSQNFGKLDNFWFAVTQEQARRALSHFIRYALPNFGDYQDAMKEGEYYLFCKTCRYDVKKRVGENACPFNFLYWAFLMRHEKRFRQNNRMRMILSHLDKMTDEERNNIKNS